MQAHEKVCNENKTKKQRKKERKKTTGAYPRVIIILMEGSSLYWVLHKKIGRDLKDLRTNYS